MITVPVWEGTEERLLQGCCSWDPLVKSHKRDLQISDFFFFLKSILTLGLIRLRKRGLHYQKILFSILLTLFPPASHNWRTFNVEFKLEIRHLHHLHSLGLGIPWSLKKGISYTQGWDPHHSLLCPHSPSVPLLLHPKLSTFLSGDHIPPHSLSTPNSPFRGKFTLEI